MSNVFKTVGLLLVILCALHLPAASQMPAKIDSLKKALVLPMADTTAAQILLSIAMKYQGFQTDSAMDYALSSLKKSESIGYTKGRADALLHIGRLKRDLDNTVEALNDMFVALKLYREIADHVQIANALNDISIIYANSGDFKSSLDYFKQALEIFRQTGDEKGESYALNNIGLIYLELDDEAAAKEHFILSLRIKEKNNDLYGISRSHINLGSIAENNQQWAEAMDYYLKADSLFRITSDTRAQAGNFVAIARVKVQQNKIAEAKAYALRGLEQSRDVKALTTMLNASKLLASLEEKGMNYKASLNYQKLYNTIADSLHNENNRANLEELKAKFNVDEKVREIALLKKDQELQQAVVERKNIVTYALSMGIVLMVLILALVYYAYATTKSKKDSLAIKNKEIQSQKDDLDTLNREKDRFFSILSHDLRGPLSSLKGLSYLLTDHVDALTPAELSQMRARINTSLDNLTELINNVLEWSMASSRKRKWLFDKINVADVIRKNISLYQAIADSKGVSLLYKPQEDLYAYGDYYAIDTVVRNLLSNGIKFSHTGKTVTLSAAKTDDKVLISVRDEGIGIPLEIQKKLFALNGAVTQPGTNNEKGIGLGLTLCMELMKENNGDIHVKSKPDEGSEFIISVPAFNGTHLARSA